MTLSDIQKDFVLHAESKALGTYGLNINVVPVSTIFIIDDKIILCNYFMQKTMANILKNPEVSLSCWSGLNGLQIKGRASYETTGMMFAEIKKKITRQHPDRLLQGIIIIRPQQLHDSSVKK